MSGTLGKMIAASENGSSRTKVAKIDEPRFTCRMQDFFGDGAQPLPA